MAPTHKSGNLRVKHRLECRDRVIEADTRSEFLKKVTEKLLQTDPDHKRRKRCDCSLTGQFECRIRRFQGSYWFVEKHLTSVKKAQLKWSLQIDCNKCPLGLHRSFQQWTKCQLDTPERDTEKPQVDKRLDAIVDIEDDVGHANDDLMQQRRRLLEDSEDFCKLVFHHEQQSTSPGHTGTPSSSEAIREWELLFNFFQEFERRLPNESESGFIHVLTIQKIVREMMEQLKEKVNRETNGTFEFERSPGYISRTNCLNLQRFYLKRVDPQQPEEVGKIKPSLNWSRLFVD